MFLNFIVNGASMSRIYRLGGLAKSKVLYFTFRGTLFELRQVTYKCTNVVPQFLQTNFWNYTITL